MPTYFGSLISIHRNIKSADFIFLHAMSIHSLPYYFLFFPCHITWIIYIYTIYISIYRKIRGKQNLVSVKWLHVKPITVRNSSSRAVCARRLRFFFFFWWLLQQYTSFRMFCLLVSYFTTKIVSSFNNVHTNERKNMLKCHYINFQKKNVIISLQKSWHLVFSYILHKTIDLKLNYVTYAKNYENSKT